MNFSSNDIPELSRLEEAPLMDAELASVIGWHVSAIGKDDILGGGLHQNRETARRIAIAETLERKYFKFIANSSLATDFQISEFPTTCGFAAGFEMRKTKLRAISEAVERWAWSKWIDDHFCIPQIEVQSTELSPLSQKLLLEFDGVKFFKFTIDTSRITGYFKTVDLGIVICEKGAGVFPGSRVSVSEDNIWDHGILEAWRHLKIFEQYKNLPQLKLPFDRVVHFGKNAEEANVQIELAVKTQWPRPSVRLIKEFKPGIEGFYLWRALMDDYLGWHLGEKNRFVY